MGSVPRDHNAVGNGNAVDAIVPKAEPAHEGSSSSVSTPDAEGEPLVQDAAPTQKRKGGRKPVCSKSIGIIIKEKKNYISYPAGTHVTHVLPNSFVLDICHLRRT